MGKRHLIIFVLAIFILISFGLTRTYAAPVGNIAKHAVLTSPFISPDKEKPLFGIIGEGEADLTFERGTEGDDDEMEVYFLTQKIGLVFADKFVLYGLLGSAWFEDEFTAQGITVDVATEKDIAWGLGATLILYEREIEKFGNPTLRFGLDGRFRYAESDFEKVIVGGTEYKLPQSAISSSRDVAYRDWQIAGAFSFQWKKFIPYFGLKYSDMDADIEVTVSGTPYQAKAIGAEEYIGVFVGMDILTLDFISYNIEYRFLDEKALTLNGTIRF